MKQQNPDLICTQCNCDIEYYSSVSYSQGRKVCPNCKKANTESDKRAFDNDMKYR